MQLILFLLQLKLTAWSVYRWLTRFGSARSRRWPSGKETSSATRIISRAKLWKRATRTPKVRVSFIPVLNNIPWNIDVDFFCLLFTLKEPIKLFRMRGKFLNRETTQFCICFYSVTQSLFWIRTILHFPMFLYVYLFCWIFF